MAVPGHVTEYLRHMKYSKTDAGQQAFKQRSASITARQRSMFILFDGHKSAEEVLATTAGMGATMADVQALVDQGYLAASGGAGASTAAQAGAPANGLSDQERFLRGSALATQITAGLGLRGFRLNLSVEHAASLQELIDLLPKIEEAAGRGACKELEAVLLG